MGKVNYFDPPELITAQHQLSLFSSGVPVLDGWLKERALKSSEYNASKTFVLHQDHRVVAYYCLATGSIEAHKVPGKIKRNMPNLIPVLVLGRLAVDQDYQGLGLGKGLLKDAVLRTLNVSQQAGIKALLVHALSQSAKHFYKRFGFVQSPLDELTLMLPVAEIAACL